MGKLATLARGACRAVRRTFAKCVRSAVRHAPPSEDAQSRYFISIFKSLIFASSKGGLRMGISNQVPFLRVDL